METRDKNSEVSTREISSQVVALAEQLGRIAGTVEGTAENWLNRAKLADQLTRVRDGAATLLESLAGAAAKGRQEVQKDIAAHASKASDAAHAPGKRHRKPAPSERGVKHSDERIPKSRVAKQVRQRRKNQF